MRNGVKESTWPSRLIVSEADEFDGVITKEVGRVRIGVDIRASTVKGREMGSFALGTDAEETKNNGICLLASAEPMFGGRPWDAPFAHLRSSCVFLRGPT